MDTLFSLGETYLFCQLVVREGGGEGCAPVHETCCIPVHEAINRLIRRAQASEQFFFFLTRNYTRWSPFFNASSSQSHRVMRGPPSPTELKESQSRGSESHGADSFLARKSFADMYNEIRASVDLCHRDGTLKQAGTLFLSDSSACFCAAHPLVQSRLRSSIFSSPLSPRIIPPCDASSKTKPRARKL